MKRNYVIAGGTSGIGLQLVEQLAPEAGQVAVLSRHAGELPAFENVTHQVCDFESPELQIENLPESINGVAYCPGSINLRSFRSLKPEDFRRDFEINVVGAVRFLQACMPGLKNGVEEGSPSVVLFSTVAVGQGMPMHASIATSKGGVEALARSLAAEWAPNIRVNCLAPALTETPLAARFFKTEESRKAMAAKYPLGRTGLPADLASAARFLLSSDSGWISGQVIGIDGGMSSLRTT